MRDGVLLVPLILSFPEVLVVIATGIALWVDREDAFHELSLPDFNNARCCCRSRNLASLGSSDLRTSAATGTEEVSGTSLSLTVLIELALYLLVIDEEDMEWP